MNNHRTSPWKLVLVLLCACALAACQLRGNRNQKPVASSTPQPASATPNAAAPGIIAPSSTEAAVSLLQYVRGRNDYELMVDDTPRKFIVHVPGGYDPSRPAPVVLVFHGSNHNGKFMYENTGWVDKAEQENILAVFPSSWRYFTTTANAEEEKWNTAELAQITSPGTQLKDDVHFVKVILEHLHATFNVDEKRIFATGGSNGGGFVMTRLAAQMNDVFAAYSTCGAILISDDIDVSTITMTVNASLYNVFGSLDEKIAELNGLTLPHPFQADDILNDPNFSRMLRTTTTLLGLDMAYTVESEADFTTFTFNNSLVGAHNEYIFRMVRGMGHIYPNGENNRAGLNVSDLFWDFFTRHPKP